MSLLLHPADSVQTPDLRILPLSALITYEYNDSQHTSLLAQQIEAEGLLKNPPICTPLYDCDNPSTPSQSYLVLDGVNHTTALQNLGYLHSLVQVVPYESPTVTLTTWRHLVTGINPDRFTTALSVVPGVDFFPINLLQARAGLSCREYLFYLILSDGRVFAISAKEPGYTAHKQSHLLNTLINTYKHVGGPHWVMTDNLEEARCLYADLTCLVIFPNYTPDEVLALARDGELLPTGLTRHSIQGRALRVNYPLSELKSTEPLQAKNTRLQEWLRKKMASKEVRFYGEMTFLFDA